MQGKSGGYSPRAPLAGPVAAAPDREPAASAPRSRPASAPRPQPASAPRAPVKEEPEGPSQQTIAPTKLKDRTLPIGAVEVPVLSFNQDRRYLFILNIGANDIWISFSPGVAAGRGVKIPANGFYEPMIAPINELYAISPTGSTLTIIEG